MTATLILKQLKARGIELQAEGDSLRYRAPKGALTPELRETLAAHKAEVLALLAASRQGVIANESIGPCPHCGNPLSVFTQLLKDSICIQCPTRPEKLTKFVKLSSDEATPSPCSDCGSKPALITGRCPECIQRLMLCPDDPCSKCGGLRYWRHKANDSQPAGFRWYCENCEQAKSRNVVWYEVG